VILYSLGIGDQLEVGCQVVTWIDAFDCGGGGGSGGGSISIRPVVDFKIWGDAAEWGFIKGGHNQVLSYGDPVCQLLYELLREPTGL
jgi:hypothetical protein